MTASISNQSASNAKRNLLFIFLAFFGYTLPALADDATPVVEQTSAIANDVEQTNDVESTEEKPEATTESCLIEQTNAYRARYNLKPLTENKKLSQACRKFAEVMARTGQMSHYADGRSPSSRVSAAGYSWSSVAENIAYRWDRKNMTNEQYAQATLNQWINSSGHRRNLLGSQYTQCGAAFATNPQTGKTFAVMVYARPGK